MESDCHVGDGVSPLMGWQPQPVPEERVDYGVSLLINWKYLLWSADLPLDQTVLAERSPFNNAGTPVSYAGMAFHSLSCSFQSQVVLNFCVAVV